jgi:transcriptional regulator with XRE-family HTH domain
MNLRLDPTKLRAILEQRALAQADLAAISGVAQNTITRVMKGESIRADTAKLIAESLGVDLEAIRASTTTIAPDEPQDLAEAVQMLNRQESVNIVLKSGSDWRPVYEQLKEAMQVLPVIDFENPLTASRPGFLSEILRVFGSTSKLPKEKPHDLTAFGEAMSQRRDYARFAIAHFDMIAEPHRVTEYGDDMLYMLRYYTTTEKMFGVVLFSRKPLSQLVPRKHPLSDFDIKTLEL